MKTNKNLSVFIDIVIFIILFLFLWFLFSFIFTMDYSVSAIPPSLRSEGDLLILKLRKILIFSLSLFVTSIVDFMGINKFLVKLKIGKYKKWFFISCLILSLILLLSLIIFYNMFPL